VTVYLLAHGSADPRHGEDVRRIAARLGAVLDDVRPCYLDHCGPTLAEVADVPGTVVPLLLSPGFHVRVDVRQAVVAAGVPLTVADPPLLTSGAAWGAALLAEVRRAWPGHGIVMVGAGTRDPGVLRQWQETSVRLGVPVLQASGPGPRLDSRLTGGRPVILPLLVARGFFGDRIVGDAAGLGLPVAGVAGSSEAFLAELRRVTGRRPRSAVADARPCPTSRPPSGSPAPGSHPPGRRTG
jgi:sirohydrochlorin ferrochelatase